jgi:hypothetical protein
MAFTPHTPVIAEGFPVTFRDQTIWRDPESFDQSHMAEIDFDETCFTTFISSGDGIEVHRAYELSVESVLGAEARQDFSSYGGLSNRAPLDVIQGLVSREPGLVVHALDHAVEHFTHPEDITDIGLGMIARFANRGKIEPDDLTLRAITEMLVIRKKEHLIPQISNEWPMPVKGFVEFWLAVNERQREPDWHGVHTAIVSSGHTDFIQTTFEMSDLPHPDVYMTDDEMRRQVRPRTKPDPYALELVRNAWMNAYLVPVESRSADDFMQSTKGRQVYIGDDVEKDGLMASNDGISFMHHDGSEVAWHNIYQRLTDVIDKGGQFDQ